MPSKKTIDGFEVLLTPEQIQERIRELGAQISKDLGDSEIVVVGVLKGSFIFMADLVRALQGHLTCDFLRVSSYDQDRSTGVVRLEFDLTQSIEDKNVLLVEDIVDSGRTLRYLLRHLQTKRPAKLRVASLLYKALHPEVRGLIDYCGFTVPDHYIVGYGLDSHGLYRALPYIAYKGS